MVVNISKLIIMACMKKLLFCFCFCAVWVPGIGFAEEDSAGGFFSAEALFWIAKEDGLGFASKPADIVSTDNFTQNPVFEPTFEWKWGFRVGANYIAGPWSYQAFWTNLDSKAQGQKTVNSEAPDYEGIF